MSKEIITTQVGDWMVKLREGDEGGTPKVIVLLHGWTGDEKSMWAFEELLPENAFVIVPRAPYRTKGTDLGGYSWVNKTVDFLPVKRDFMPAVYGVNVLLGELSLRYPKIDFNKMAVVGFSQGAAMAIAFADAYAEKVAKLGILAGFLPDDLEADGEVIDGLSVFISHGEKDDVVPVENAEKIRDYYQVKAENVIYCLADTGHRLGKDCAKGLDKFLAK